MSLHCHRMDWRYAMFLWKLSTAQHHCCAYVYYVLNLVVIILSRWLSWEKLTLPQQSVDLLHHYYVANARGAKLQVLL